MATQYNQNNIPQALTDFAPTMDNPHDAKMMEILHNAYRPTPTYGRQEALRDLAPTMDNPNDSKMMEILSGRYQRYQEPPTPIDRKLAAEQNAAIAFGKQRTGDPDRDYFLKHGTLRPLAPSPPWQSPETSGDANQGRWGGRDIQAEMMAKQRAEGLPWDRVGVDNRQTIDPSRMREVDREMEDIKLKRAVEYTDAQAAGFKGTYKEFRKEQVDKQAWQYDTNRGLTTDGFSGWKSKRDKKLGGRRAAINKARAEAEPNPLKVAANNRALSNNRPVPYGSLLNQTTYDNSTVDSAIGGSPQYPASDMIQSTNPNAAPVVDPNSLTGGYNPNTDGSPPISAPPDQTPDLPPGYGEGKPQFDQFGPNDFYGELTRDNSNYVQDPSSVPIQPQRGGDPRGATPPSGVGGPAIDDMGTPDVGYKRPPLTQTDRAQSHANQALEMFMNQTGNWIRRNASPMGALRRGIGAANKYIW